MMRDYLQGCLIYDRNLWVVNGGLECLASYDVTNHSPGNVSIPSDHISFLDGLKLYHQEPGFVFVHGGFIPGLPLEQNRWRDMLWPRDAFYRSRYVWPEGIIVFGHTPFDDPLVEPNKIGIDTGCSQGGPLMAVKLPKIEFFQSYG